MPSRLDPDDFYTADLIRELGLELLKTIGRSPSEGLAACHDLFSSRVSDPHARIMIFETAANAAANAGCLGLDFLGKTVATASWTNQRRIALQALWSVAQGSMPRVSNRDDPQVTVKPVDSSYARSKLSDVIVDSLNNRKIMDAVLFVASHEEAWAPQTTESFTDFFVKTVAESTISLTKRSIGELSDLVTAQAAEKEYQNFLTANPVFLDPLAAEIIPLAPLGLEYKTDFVIRRHDGSYLVVEIEKPQDRIFTMANDFTAEFTHATGQVLDFQHWVSSNIAYAQTKFPGIYQPQGLLVMGMRSGLSKRSLSKLQQWQANSRYQDFMTYDDLLDRASLLLRSLRPVEERE